MTTRLFCLAAWLVAVGAIAESSPVSKVPFSMARSARDPSNNSLFFLLSPFFFFLAFRHWPQLVSSFASDEACAAEEGLQGKSPQAPDVVVAMRRGWWSCAEALAEAAAASGSAPVIASRYFPSYFRHIRPRTCRRSFEFPFQRK